MAHRGFWSRKVGFAVAVAIALASIGWGGAARAACTSCSLDGPGVGTSNGIEETGQGQGAFGSNNDTGASNSAFGFNALRANTMGAGNSATGWLALESNGIGTDNTADGAIALFRNTSGNANTATGGGALQGNTTGDHNTADGNGSLASNIAGNRNTSTGVDALVSSFSGDDNTADGHNALTNVDGGSNNIGIGSGAGSSLITGSDDIYIGDPGAANESNTIRIGDPTIHTATFVAGIVGTPMSKSSASEVVIDANGQLGVKVSSARYKRDIHDMGNSSAKLMKLRPVSFRYKQDPDGSVQYGLIAEEVAPVYPELVTYGADGKVQGVHYDLLPAMLLNEVQKQAKDSQRKDAKIAAQQRQIDALIERLNTLEREVRRARPERVVSAMP